jgi:uncharacterized membrane protein (UPF0127 family)
MRVDNITTTNEIACNLIVAENIFSRIKGLLGKKSMPIGEALLLKPCKGIHTFGMKFPIDVIFLDKRNRVMAVVEDLKPNRMTSLLFNAASVLEVPAGVINTSSTKVGDEVAIV